MPGTLLLDDWQRIVTDGLQQFGQGLLNPVQDVSQRLQQFGLDRLNDVSQTVQPAQQAIDTARLAAEQEMQRQLEEQQRRQAQAEAQRQAAEEAARQQQQQRLADLDAAIHRAAQAQSVGLGPAQNMPTWDPNQSVQENLITGTGIDPYGQIFQRGVSQILRGVQQGDTGTILGGALSTAQGLTSALPGAGGASRVAEAAAPRLAEALAPEAPGALNAVKNFLTGAESEAGAVPLMLGARLGGAAAGGVAGWQTTPQELPWWSPERAARTAFGTAAGFTAPGVVEAALTRPQIDQAVLESLRQGGIPQSVAHINPATPANVAVDLSKQGLLTDPQQHAANLVGNVIELLRQPVSLTLGGRPAEAGAGLMAVVRSIPEAAQNAALALRGTQVPTLGSGMSQTPWWQPVYRLLGAADLFSRTMGEYQGMASRGIALLREQGLQPGTAAADQYLAQHAAELYQEGAHTGATGVFGTTGAANETWLDQLMQRFGNYKQGLLQSARPLDQALGLLLDFQLPFQGTPTRVWQVALQRVPGISQFSGVARAAGALQRGDQLGFARAAGETVLESMIQAQIANGIREGNITGPDDPEHPHAIRLGGQWYDYNGWSAYSLPMAIMASFAEGYAKSGNQVDADQLERFAAGLNASMKPLVRALPGSTFVDMLASMGEGGLTRGLTRNASSALSRLVAPAGLKAAEDIMDPVTRDIATQGPAALWQPTVARIPWVAQMLPPKIDPSTGEPLPRPSSGPGSLVGAYNAPENLLRAEVARLNRAGLTGVTLPKDYPQQVSVFGSEIPLRPGEQRAVTQTTGHALAQMAQALSSPGYQKAGDTEKALALKAILGVAESLREPAALQAMPQADLGQRYLAGRRVVGQLQPSPEEATRTRVQGQVDQDIKTLSSSGAGLDEDAIAQQVLDQMRARRASEAEIDLALEQLRQRFGRMWAMGSLVVRTRGRR